MTTGACIEALDDRGRTIEEGSPVVCTLLDTDKYADIKGSVSMLSTA